MKILCGFIFIFFASTCYANVSGLWRGWVYWTFQGSGTKCISNISFSETDGFLIRTEGFFDCDLVTMNLNTVSLEKKQNKLYLNGVDVGVYDGKKYSWVERYSDQVVIQISINNNGTNMDYIEKWIESDGSLLYDINGRFFLTDEQ